MTEEKTPEEALKEGLDELKEKYSVKETLVTMIKEYGRKALEYKGKMENAKTSTKEEYYRKKLVENNEEAADAIAALQELLDKEKEDGISDENGRTEASSDNSDTA